MYLRHALNDEESNIGIGSDPTFDPLLIVLGQAPRMLERVEEVYLVLRPT